VPLVLDVPGQCGLGDVRKSIEGILKIIKKVK
jgi:hypothetical protein